MASGNRSLSRIEAWTAEHGLELAPEKTEAIIVKGPKKREGIHFVVGNVDIRPKKYVKYLGVWLDDRRISNEHIKKICEKADRQVAALTKILPNTRRPGAQKRKILYGVVQSVLLYAAPVWGQVIRIDRYRNMLISMQRKMLLRAVMAYRTVSAEALCVIAAIPPIDLKVKESMRLYDLPEVDSRKWKQEQEVTLDLVARQMGPT
nr:uncharacterized protein LOC111510951 [Leptinotarsa decemlineata]